MARAKHSTKCIYSEEMDNAIYSCHLCKKKADVSKHDVLVCTACGNVFHVKCYAVLNTTFAVCQECSADKAASNGKNKNIQV